MNPSEKEKEDAETEVAETTSKRWKGENEENKEEEESGVEAGGEARLCYLSRIPPHMTT